MSSRRQASVPFDPEKTRAHFPLLARREGAERLVYLDNATTTQKPQAVIDAIDRFYANDNGNVHRGIHALSERATRAFEGAREKVRQFIGATAPSEIVFVRGTTEAINLVAQSYGRSHLGPDDEIVLTVMEHHSNIVPWQVVAQERGARLRVVPVSDAGELDLDEYERILGRRTRLVAVTHVSNALGTINPVRRITEMAHRLNVPVLIDGAQAVPHLSVDVRDLDCDFYAFSGHKLYGPTGIGVLYGKAAILESLPPYQTGGDMIRSVSFDETLYREPPHRFEAGTPNIAGAIGLGAAIDHVAELGIDAISEHEKGLLALATDAVGAIPGVRILGAAAEKTSVLSFVMEGVHPHDIGTILDQEGVAIRTGHHCAEPLMHRFGVDATARASFAHYNTPADVTALVDGLHRVTEIFAG